MKKIFSLMVMVVWMMITFATPAAGKTINVVVDDPSHVTVMVVGEYETTPLIFDADNSAQLTFQSDVPVVANSGWEIVSITTASGSSATTSNLPATTAEIAASLVQDGETVRIVTDKKYVKTFTIEAEHPEHIAYVSYKYQYMEPVADGIWEIEITDNYDPVFINVNPDYKVTSFKDSFGNELSYSNNTPSVSGVSYNESMTFYVSTKSREEDRTARLNINFEGDPNSVSLIRNGNSVINLVEGGQTVYYDPEDEVPFTLSSTIYKKNIYNVELNGEKVSKNEDGTYIIYPTNEGILDITVEYPDIDVPVHISYASNDLEGVISSVIVNNEPVDASEWSSSDFKVKAGSTLEFNFDYVHFALPTVTVNGESATMPIFIEVVDECNIVISAELIPNNNITIYCDLWQSLDVMADSETFELTGVETTISVPSSINYLQFKPRDNYVIEGVYDINTNTRYELLNGYLSDLKDGMKLDVELYLYERNEVAIVYVEPAPWDMVVIRMGHEDLMNEVALQPGYNTVRFNKDDLPLMISGYANVDGNYLSPEVYVNGNLCIGQYGVYEELGNLVNNDVISIYSRQVEPLNVTMVIDEQVNVEIVKNLVHLVDETNFTVLPGTLVQVKGTGIVVKANGENVAADENGIFNVTVDVTTDIVVSADTNTGVDVIEAGETVDVYTLGGVLVRKSISVDEINSLPAGVYVVGGKKVIVK